MNIYKKEKYQHHALGLKFVYQQDVLHGIISIMAKAKINLVIGLQMMVLQIYLLVGTKK
jgi:hypothetical protein